MEILNFTPVVSDKGSTVATFDVYFPKSKETKYNFKVIRTKKGSYFGVRPSYARDVDGERKYFPYFTYEGERDKEFDKQLQEALKDKLDVYATEINRL